MFRSQFNSSKGLLRWHKIQKLGSESQNPSPNLRFLKLHVFSIKNYTNASISGPELAFRQWNLVLESFRTREKRWWCQNFKIFASCTPLWRHWSQILPKIVKKNHFFRESTEYCSYGIPWESHLMEYRNVTEFRNLTLRNSIILRNSESISVQQLEGDRHDPVTFVLGQHKKNSNVPDPTVFVSKTCFTTFKI